MPFCPNCGAEYRSSPSFCSACGAALFTAPGIESSIGANVGEGIPTELRYHISLKRVLFMTVLSVGLFLFYWFYITWKQYRDHTQADAYPVWHALTLLVPIYGLFRTHAHARTFRDLIRDAGIPGSIEASIVVVLSLIAQILGNVSFALSADAGTLEDAIVIAVIDAIAIVLVLFALLHLQSNLNRYWQGFTYMRTDIRRSLSQNRGRRNNLRDYWALGLAGYFSVYLQRVLADGILSHHHLHTAATTPSAKPARAAPTTASRMKWLPVMMGHQWRRESAKDRPAPAYARRWLEACNRPGHGNSGSRLKLLLMVSLLYSFLRSLLDQPTAPAKPAQKLGRTNLRCEPLPRLRSGNLWLTYPLFSSCKQNSGMLALGLAGYFNIQRLGGWDFKPPPSPQRASAKPARTAPTTVQMKWLPVMIMAQESAKDRPAPEP